MAEPLPLDVQPAEALPAEALPTEALPTEAFPCPVPPDLAPLLPGFSFADSFQIAAPEGRCAVGVATRHIFSRQPGWIAILLKLRDAFVAPFGLKGVDAAPHASIGWFPVVSESERRIVLGFDDKHLDFRIVIDAETETGAGMAIRATTLVKPHNFAGRAYLALVLPFHRVIVPRMLNRLLAA